MKFGRMYMNGFGIYRDRSIEVDAGAPVVMFLGRNEAGKSTIMGFIRAMLFGFPTRANMPDRYEPAAGGIHGGSLTLIDPRGSAVRLERYEKNGSLKLMYDDGAEAGEAALQAMLGGITADMYRNLFAFGLGELQKLDALHAEEVSGFLFSSGMGLSGGAIVQTERKLAGRMESLYKPKGTKQEINKWLKEIESIELELRRSKEQSDRFGVVQSDLQTLEAQIRESELALETQRSQREWYNKCKQSRGAWFGLREKRLELSMLPPALEIPEDALHRLDQLLADQGRLLERNDWLKVKREEMQQDILQHQYDEALIGRSSELEFLLETAIAYQEAGHRLIELAKELESEQAEFARHLRQIDADWTMGQLGRFPISIGERERIGGFAERFADIGANKTVITAELEQLSTKRESLVRTGEADQTQLDAITERMRNRFPGRKGSSVEASELNLSEFEASVRREWELARSDASDLDYAIRRLEETQRSADLLGRSGNTRDRAGLGIAAGVSVTVIAAGIVAALWLGLQTDQLSAAIIVFSMSVAVAVMWYAGVKLLVSSAAKASANTDGNALKRELESRSEAARLEVDVLRRRFADRHIRLTELLGGNRSAAEAAAGISASVNTDVREVIRGWEPVIDSFEQQAAAWRRMEQELEHTRLRAGMSERALSDWSRDHAVCLERENSLTAEEAGLKAEWTEWLRGYELSDKLLPETVLLMGQFAEQALQAAERISKAESKLSAIRTMRAEFEHAASSLLSLSGAGVPNNLADLPIALKRLKEQAEEQWRIRDRVRQLVDQEEALRLEYDALTEGLQRAGQRLGELYRQCSVIDEQGLRRAVSHYNRRMELTKEIRHLEVAVFTWIKAEQAQRLEETLQQLDADQLNERLSELSHLVERIEAELNDLKDRRGRLRNELERLSNGDEHSALLLSRQESLAGFEQSATAWMQLALADELIGKAKEVYERERQPGVLLQASHYFSKITDGRYTRVVSRLGEKVLFVEKENGERVDSVFLSRGTAEQLYLAMRFALADEYAKTVTLPLVMDDIFVNFDRHRLKQTLSVLSDVAKRRQLLLFTCHEHVAEAVQAALPGTQLIALEHTSVNGGV